jgi:hypothetical protein
LFTLNIFKNFNALRLSQKYFRKIDLLAWAPRDKYVTVGVNRYVSMQGKNVFLDRERPLSVPWV